MLRDALTPLPATSLCRESVQLTLACSQRTQLLSCASCVIFVCQLLNWRWERTKKFGFVFGSGTLSMELERCFGGGHLSRINCNCKYRLIE